MIHEREIKIQYANNSVPIPLNGRATLASVTAAAQGSAWGTGVLTVKWSNDQAGPQFSFGTGEVYNDDATLGPGDDSIPWINVQGKGFLWVGTGGTAEGADETVNVRVCEDSDA